MNHLTLSPVAEWLITATHLQRDKQDLIRDCISRYSQFFPAGETLAWIVFRVTNAIKSLFGQSKWQVTQKILCDHAIELAKTKNIIQLNSQNRTQQIINRALLKFAALWSSNVLSLCLWANTPPYITEEEEARVQRFKADKKIELDLEKNLQIQKSKADQLLQVTSLRP